MEWLCAVSGIDSREDLEHAYTTIRELIIDPPDPVRHVSIKRLSISRSEEKETHAICIHSLAVPPDIDQLAQLVSLLIGNHHVHVWAMGPEVTEIALSAMETTHMPPERILKRVVGHEPDAPDAPTSNAANTSR